MTILAIKPVYWRETHQVLWRWCTTTSF